MIRHRPESDHPFPVFRNAIGLRFASRIPPFARWRKASFNPILTVATDKSPPTREIKPSTHRQFINTIALGPCLEVAIDQRTSAPDVAFKEIP